MKKFMDENFLLSTDASVHLFHDFAENMPIVDYHCHLVPREIAEDAHFSNITEAWLYADHYKWRAMRACGVAEKYVTGGEGVTDYERFAAYASCMPRLVGNPLYHWTHLELQRYFGVEDTLDEHSCEAIWNTCNKKIGDFSARGLITSSGVTALCTTDDPSDDLSYHRAIKKDGFGTRVLPAYRPDKAVNIELDGFVTYVRGALSKRVGYAVDSFENLLAAFSETLSFFCENGCVTADHGMNYVPYAEPDFAAASNAFRKRMAGETLTKEECDAFKTYVLLFFAKEYTKRHMVMQLHFGVTRNVDGASFAALGADSGFDTIDGYQNIGNLLKFFDECKSQNALPKTVVYSLNPTDNALLDAACGSFQRNDDGIRSRMQHGSAWWFNDSLVGMNRHLETMASIGVLGNFVGMLTDSRSFLSYTRHEYFRRILCDYVGRQVENGLFIADEGTLKALIENICYRNAVGYFGFDKA